MAFNATIATFSPTAVPFGYGRSMTELEKSFEAAKQQILSHPLTSSLCFIVAGFLICVLRAVTIRYLHLSAFPGPSWAAYTRIWLSKTIASGDSARKFVDVNQKYGSLARIGPNHLLTDDPEFTRKILAARSRYTRGPWFDSTKIDPRVPHIVSERHPGKHNHLRHQLSGAYTGKDTEGLEDTIGERIREFVDRIEQHWLSDANGTKIFDIARRIQFLTVDTITHLFFGEPLGFIKTDSDVFSFLARIETQLPIAQHFSVFLELNSILLWVSRVPFLGRVIVPSSRDKGGIGIIMGITKRLVEQRLQPDSEPKKDVLASFMKHGLSSTEAEAEISISVIVGSDSTATAIRAILLAIISNPRVYIRLVAELDEAETNGDMSSPIGDQEARRLPYLQACIKEGLRRFPPVTLLRERLVPPGGDTYNGQYIPEGTFIGLNAWGAQLNPVFGDDPQVFRPERWLIDDSERLHEMLRVQDLIFGHGTTRCLGIAIATTTLNKIFPELLRRFDISVINAGKPWTSICYGIFLQKEFNVRITRRKQTSASKQSGNVL